MEIRGFSGLRNTTSPERLKPGELVTALDIDLDNTGRPLTRRGYTRVNAAGVHSLFSNHRLAMCVSGNVLSAIEYDFSLTPIKTLQSSDRLAAETVNDLVFYSNGVDTGRLIGRTPGNWGVTPPTGQPMATELPGTLPPGRYLYAVTFVRGDGHESGTGLAGQIDITRGGIGFTNIAVSPDAEVKTKNLYISEANGEVMYLALSVSNTSTFATYQGSGLNLTIPLTTQFASPPPPSELMRVYNGVMYVAVEDVVYYSDPYNFELFRLDTNFLQFPGEVVMFEGVNDGVYVGTPDSGGDDVESVGYIWFLSGDRPDQFKSTQLFDYGVIEDSAVKTDAAYFDAKQGDQAGEQAHPIIVWTTRHGVCVGRDSGSVQNLTEVQYSFPTAQRAAAIVRQDRGYVSYISTLQGPGALTNKYVENITA
jgi:hypothetical protein